MYYLEKCQIDQLLRTRNLSLRVNFLSFSPCSKLAAPVFFLTPFTALKKRLLIKWFTLIVSSFINVFKLTSTVVWWKVISGFFFSFLPLNAWNIEGNPCYVFRAKNLFEYRAELYKCDWLDITSSFLFLSYAIINGLKFETFQNGELFGNVFQFSHYINNWFLSFFLYLLFKSMPYKICSYID